MSVENQTNSEALNELERQLNFEKQRREIVTDYLGCAIWEYSIEKKCQYQYKKLDGKWSENKEPVYDYRNTMKAWGLIFPDDLPVFDRYCDSMDRGESDFVYDIRMYGDGEEFIWLRYTGRAICDQNGRAVGVLGTTTDVTEEKNCDRVKLKEADTDRVTGLLNYRILSKAKDIAESGAEKILALVMIDIDNYSYIKSVWGNIYADYVLQNVGNILKSVFLGRDMTGRMGENHFIVLARSFRDEKELEASMEKLMSKIRSVKLTKKGKITLSAGVCINYGGSVGFSDIYTHAEKALKRVRKNGGDGYVICSSEAVEEKAEAVSDERFEVSHAVMSDFDSEPELDSHGKNIIYFTGKTLAVGGDLSSSVDTIFAEFGKQYALDSIFIIEKKPKTVVALSHYWDSENKNEGLNAFENFAMSHWNETCRLMSEKGGVVVCRDIHEHDSEFKHLKNYSRLRSIIICGIYDSGITSGYIVFNCATYRNWGVNEITACRATAGLIGTYLVKQFNRISLQEEIFYSSAILDSKNIASYAINPETFEITYASRHAPHIFKNLTIGEKCYRSIMGFASPCHNCPSFKLDSLTDKAEVEYYNSGLGKWLSTTATKIKSRDGKLRHLMCVSDVTQFIDRVQSQDRLTGLMTFDRFEVEGSKRLHELAGGYYLAVVKILKFRTVNDDFGYETGNVILRETAGKFKKSLLEDEFLCRGSGSTFFAVLRADADWWIVNRLENLFMSIQGEIEKYNPHVKFFFGAGIYRIDKSDVQFSSAMDKANIALKMLRGGKYITANTVRVYDKSLDDEIKLRTEIERTMLIALHNKEFRVFYQPKVELSTEKIYGAEALVRWIKPDGGIIPPSLFVPIFEDNEFITEMDFYVYDRVLGDMCGLRSQGKKLPVISVNVSRHHLNGDDFPEKFCRLVDSYNIPHDRIEIELTETAFFNNLDHLIGIMKRIRKMGFKISVDDFGTGYSSLNLISVLPVDVLKVDGNFFKSNQLNTKNKKVIGSIFSLAKSLSLYTVSEGVETKEQIDFLKECNCDSVQGFYFYKPMNLEEFTDVLESCDKMEE